MSGGGPEASGASTGEVTQAPGRDWSSLIGRGVITLVTLAGFAWLLDLPLLGFDAWPLVAAARWEGAGDLQRLRLGSQTVVATVYTCRLWIPLAKILSGCSVSG